MVIIKKHKDGTFESWMVDIPENDPLWIALCEKYETEGYSECGMTLAETLQSVKESL